MVEKATLGVLIAVSLVPALSFKDLMTIKMASASDEDNKGKSLNTKPGSEGFGEPVVTADATSTAESKTIDDEFGDVDSDRLDRDDADSEQVAKKIPKLKIKSNVQTIKFLFW